MADQSQTEKKLNIPAATLAQFPQLIPMIQKSPSMNDEERQYWVDVLPVMTKDQIENLEDILRNEKKQIEEAKKAYGQGIEEESGTAQKAFDEEAYRAKKKARESAEKMEEVSEKENEKRLLEEINQL